jgi:outer membrane protein with beta-barrel domain
MPFGCPDRDHKFSNHSHSLLDNMPTLSKSVTHNKIPFVDTIRMRTSWAYEKENVMLRSSLVLLVLALSVSANAEDFDYSYLQLDYGNLEFDDINVDGDGLGISGSFAINPDWHVFAGYQSVGLDFGIDANSFNAGVGYNTEMSPTVDAYARLSYEYIELDAPAGLPGADESGIGFGVGMRFAASDLLEVDAAINYVDFGGSGGDDTAFSLGALYSFSDAFALGLEGSWSSDVKAYILNGRFYFGN